LKIKESFSLLDKSLSSPSGKTNGKNQSNENPNNINIILDSEIKNSDVPDSEIKNHQKMPELSSRREQNYTNPNSRIFPGEIQLDEVQEIGKNNDINKLEWDNYLKNFEEKNKNSHRKKEDPKQKKTNDF